MGKPEMLTTTHPSHTENVNWLNIDFTMLSNIKGIKPLSNFKWFMDIEGNFLWRDIEKKQIKIENGKTQDH